MGVSSSSSSESSFFFVRPTRQQQQNTMRAKKKVPAAVEAMAIASILVCSSVSCNESFAETSSTAAAFFDLSDLEDFLGGGGASDESFEGDDDFLEGGGESLSDPFLVFLVAGDGLGLGLGLELELFFPDFLDGDGDESGAAPEDFTRLLLDRESGRCRAYSMTLNNQCKVLGCLVGKKF